MRYVPLYALLFCVACATGTATNRELTPRTQTVLTGREESVTLTQNFFKMTTEFDAPREQVWKALMAAHDELGIPIAEANPEAGTALYYVQSYNHNIAGKSASTYVDCGSGLTGPRADTYRITLHVTEAIETPLGHPAKLHTSIVASARNNGVAADELQCSTTGALEKRIAGMVAKQLQP